MDAFIGLIKKDLKMSKTMFLFWFAILVFVNVLGVGLSQYYNDPKLFSVFSITAVVVHLLYMFGFLINHLPAEARTQSWLHNPNSGFLILGSKGVTGLICLSANLVIALLLTNLSLRIMGNKYLTDDLVQITTFGYSFYIFIGLLYISLLAAMWIIFYWAFYHSVKNIPFIKSIRWLIIIGSWVLFSEISSYIEGLAFFKKLQSMWLVVTPKAMSFNFSFGNATVRSSFGEVTHVSLMICFIHLGVAFILFLIAVWLFERKIEV